MRTIEILCAGVALAVLSGCSSPPEPAQLEWDKPGSSVNTTIPQWSENSLFLPSDKIDGHWSTTIIFNPDTAYPPHIWYAVAHSALVMVNAPDGQHYFYAKHWLRKHGYTGVIIFQPKQDYCLFSNTTNIYFSR